MQVAAYTRVSTAEQGLSGLGLAAQQSQIENYVALRGWEIVESFEDVTSGKGLQRPGLDAAIALVESRKADGIVVAKLDRLSRSLLDFTSLMERSRKKDWALVALDLGMDTTSPSGEMVANVLVTFAQFERRLIGQRTKDALAAKKAAGAQLGRPVVLPEAVRVRLEALRADGRSYRAIAEEMNQEGVPTAHGGDRWHGNTVRQILISAAS